MNNLYSRRIARSHRQNLSPESTIQIIDPREEMRKLKKKVKEELVKSTQLVANAREMGFERKQIKAAFKRYKRIFVFFRGKLLRIYVKN